MSGAQAAQHEGEPRDAARRARAQDSAHLVRILQVLLLHVEQVERAGDVGEDVVGLLDAARESDEPVFDAQRVALLGRDVPIRDDLRGGGGGVRGGSAAAGQRRMPARRGRVGREGRRARLARTVGCSTRESQPPKLGAMCGICSVSVNIAPACSPPCTSKETTPPNPLDCCTANL